MKWPPLKKNKALKINDNKHSKIKLIYLHALKDLFFHKESEVLIIQLSVFNLSSRKYSFVILTLVQMLLVVFLYQWRVLRFQMIMQTF